MNLRKRTYTGRKEEHEEAHRRKGGGDSRRRELSERVAEIAAS